MMVTAEVVRTIELPMGTEVMIDDSSGPNSHKLE